MNLLVDFGNTRIKAGLFDRGALRDMRVFDGEADFLSFVQTPLHIQHCMIASVTQQHAGLVEELKKHFETHIFSAQNKLPFKNLYKSALTLGSDRIAASAGAWTLHPHKNVLTIDAGTCIKYNLVTAADEYLGGAISPGLNMRLKAMHYYTAALPEVAPDASYEQLIGRSTTESILTGAQVAAACEIDEMISRYRSEYSDLIVMLTGGDADYLGKLLKNRFFASRELLLLGLNTILQLHLEK